MEHRPAWPGGAGLGPAKQGSRIRNVKHGVARSSTAWFSEACFSKTWKIRREKMSNIVRASVRIRGTRPLFFHTFGPESIPLEKSEREGVAGNNPSEWKKTYRATKDGELYLTPDQFFRCLFEGARHTKKGRGSIQKDVGATLQIDDIRILTGRKMWSLDEAPPTDDTLPVYLDIRGVVNPTNKARNVRYRVVCSPDWECEFHPMWDKTVVNRAQMNAVCIDAGRLVGVGNGRGIGMGKFEIVSFTVDEDGV